MIHDMPILTFQNYHLNENTQLKKADLQTLPQNTSSAPHTVTHCQCVDTAISGHQVGKHDPREPQACPNNPASATLLSSPSPSTVAYSQGHHHIKGSPTSGPLPTLYSAWPFLPAIPECLTSGDLPKALPTKAS